MTTSPGRRRRPLRCRAVRRLLQAYLDAEIAPVSGLRVAEHLLSCRRCGLEADAYRWLVRSLAWLAGPDDRDSLARLRAFADELAAMT